MSWPGSFHQHNEDLYPEKMPVKICRFLKNQYPYQNEIPACSPFLAKFKYVSWDLIWQDEEPQMAKIYRRLTKFVLPDKPPVFAWRSLTQFSFFLFCIPQFVFNSLTIQLIVSMTAIPPVRKQLNVSIAKVGRVIIDRLERIWWRRKRHVKSFYFRKFGNMVNRVHWECLFFAQWRRVVKPIIYSNSPKLGNSPKHHSERRFFRKSSNFLAYFWAPRYAGFVTEVGRKLST